MADALIELPDAFVRPLPSVGRWLLHCEPDDAAAVGAALKLDLPSTMLRSAAAGDWHALHLAPDEWLLIGDEVCGPKLTAAAETIPFPLSLVDVSDRTLGLEIAGAAATTLLAAGCPLDLADAAFPNGACTRTIFGKAPVMLWRRGDLYWLEAARSFMDYVTLLLETAARERR